MLACVIQFNRSSQVSCTFWFRGIFFKPRHNPTYSRDDEAEDETCRLMSRIDFYGAAIKELQEKPVRHRVLYHTSLFFSNLTVNVESATQLAAHGVAQACVDLIRGDQLPNYVKSPTMLAVRNMSFYSTTHNALIKANALEMALPYTKLLESTNEADLYTGLMAASLICRL